MNTGNVRLANVTIKGAINCSMAAGQLLSPGSSFNCTVSLGAVGLLAVVPALITKHQHKRVARLVLLYLSHIQHKTMRQTESCLQDSVTFARP